MATDPMTQTVPTQLPAEWRDFFALTKPRVMSLVIFTGLCGLCLLYTSDAADE